jgi:hypothetical protein
MGNVFYEKGKGNAKKKSTDELITANKPIELGFQRAPAAADFDGFDAALGNVFEVGRA